MFKRLLFAFVVVLLALTPFLGCAHPVYYATPVPPTSPPPYDGYMYGPYHYYSPYGVYYGWHRPHRGFHFHGNPVPPRIRTPPPPRSHPAPPPHRSVTTDPPRSGVRTNPPSRGR